MLATKIGTTPRKRNSLFTMATSLALVMLLCSSMVLPAFADDPPNYAVGTETSPARAAITKVLRMAPGTTTPAGTYNFTITAKHINGGHGVQGGVDYDNVATLGLPGYMPTVSGTSITYDGTEAGKLEESDTIKKVYKETDEANQATTSDIFAGITWPHAGIFTYTVKETTPTSGAIPGITYSLAEYDVDVYVANKSGGGLYVAAIGAIRVKKDDGTNEATNTKVIPPPGGDPTVTGDYSKMEFINNYTKSGGLDPREEGDHRLDINKIVARPNTAEDTDFGDRTKYFNFTVTIQKPATITETPTTYKAYVVIPNTTAVPGKEFEVVTSVKNVENSSLFITEEKDEVNNKYGDYILVTAGTEITIKLQHNQHLVFVGDLHYGSTYIAVEKGEPGYIAKVGIYDGTSTAITLENTNTNTNRSTADPGKPADPEDLAHPDGIPAVNERIIKDSGRNKADFTNTFETVTPTGISVDNLPYIILIAVVITALAGFVVIKSRKRVSRSEE